MDENEYSDRAQRELRALVAALDELAELDSSDDFDCELENDIITVDFSDGSTYVINSHRAARQIWMAADHQAWHFDWQAASHSWHELKRGGEIWEVLRQRLASKLTPDSVKKVFKRPASLAST